MKRISQILGLLYLTSSMSLFAQNEQDIINYTWMPLGGSARFTGMGGAFNALGGDLSAIGFNPAATGVFLKSEMSFSTGYQSMLSTSKYANRSAEDFNPRFNVNNFGLASAVPLEEGSKWKRVNLAYSYNRIKDFNYNLNFAGTTPQYSLSDQFALDALGTPEGDLSQQLPLTSYLAYATYLIDPDTLSPGNDYYSNFGTGDMNHNYRQTSTGRMGENLFSIGANYDNKWYFGAALGITSIRHNLVDIYKESDANPNALISDFTYNYSLSTEGSGVNGRFGLIYRATQNLRLGFSYQTPTSFRINHLFAADMSTKYKDQSSPYFAESDLYQMVYRTISPGRLGLGLAYLFGQKGLISVDLNYQDYASARFANVSSAYGVFNQYDFADNNKAIRQYLGNVSQVKIGGEYRPGKLAIRAGYNWMANPVLANYRGNGSIESSLSTVSMGLGYAFKTFSLDMSIVSSRYSNDYYLYPIAQVAGVERSLLMANFGVVFRY